MGSMCPPTATRDKMEDVWKMENPREEINGNSRILNWRYVSTILLAIFCADIPLHRPKKNRPYIYGRYLQFRFLKLPVNKPQKHTKSLWCHQTLGNPPAMELCSEDQLDPLAGKMQNPVNLIPIDPNTSE